MSTPIWDFLCLLLRLDVKNLMFSEIINSKIFVLVTSILQDSEQFISQDLLRVQHSMLKDKNLFQSTVLDSSCTHNKMLA